MGIKKNFTLPPVDVCGYIKKTIILYLDTPRGYSSKLRITSFLGPQGPLPERIQDKMIVKYGGNLIYGNHFGECEVIVSVEQDFTYSPGITDAIANIFMILAGETPKEPEIIPTTAFSAHGSITINPPSKPTFNPSSISVQAGSPGRRVPVEVTVTPPCVYDIVFAHNDELTSHLQILPSLLKTNAHGKGIIEIGDLINSPRGPITVTGTISPQSPCRGNPVVGKFDVTVVQ